MIEVFADVSCPFAYVGLSRMIERRDRLGSDEILRIKAWPLELVNGEPLTARLVADEVAALRRHVAPDLFTGFDPSHFPASTLPALALSAAAYRVGAATGEHMSLALRRSLFEEGRDISRPDLLDALAADLHVPPSSADITAVIAEWHEGQRRGVDGSPHFFVNGQGYFCPSLDISHAAGVFEITTSDDELDDFERAAFGPTPIGA